MQGTTGQARSMQTNVKSEQNNTPKTKVGHVNTKQATPFQFRTANFNSSIKKQTTSFPVL